MSNLQNLYSANIAHELSDKAAECGLFCYRNLDKNNKMIYNFCNTKGGINIKTIQEITTVWADIFDLDAHCNIVCLHGIEPPKTPDEVKAAEYAIIECLITFTGSECKTREELISALVTAFYNARRQGVPQNEE